MLTNFKKYDFICSIEAYEECQPTAHTDQTFQQLNKRPEGMVIMSYFVICMWLIKVTFIT